jgi:hypothetical protein
MNEELEVKLNIELNLASKLNILINEEVIEINSILQRYDEHRSNNPTTPFTLTDTIFKESNPQNQIKPPEEKIKANIKQIKSNTSKEEIVFGVDCFPRKSLLQCRISVGSWKQSEILQRRRDQMDEIESSEENENTIADSLL